MIKSKSELKKSIDELEVLIEETDREIAKAFRMTESMFEPMKSDFIKELEFKKIQLDTNKLMLIHFKMMEELL